MLLLDLIKLIGVLGMLTTLSISGLLVNLEERDLNKKTEERLLMYSITLSDDIPMRCRLIVNYLDHQSLYLYPECNGLLGIIQDDIKK